MSREKILIVEDNAINMELAADLLEVAGYCTFQATTAETGIDLARHEKPDLILMDEGLPGIDGLAAVAVLQQHPETRSIPVVMVTAHAMKGDRERALKAGCAGYIPKPIDTRTFADSVAHFLTRTPPAAPAPATFAEPAEYSIPGSTTDRTPRILIVDDEEANRDLLESLVEMMGYEAVTASDGIEALAKLTPEIDLVLLDVMMAGMNGFEVCQSIRSDPQFVGLPIVMVTALTEKEDRLRAVEVGANDFITKPIDKIELRVRMSSQLRMKEAQDEIKRQREELHRRNAEMEADLNLAREIQQAFLPQQSMSFPRLVGPCDGALSFHHRYYPASTLGGDFSDVLIVSETEAAVFICDVMGHGVRSALVTAVARGLVEELLPCAGDPGRFLTNLNHDLAAIIGRSRTRLFASAFFLIADVARREVRYANAGHPIPLHVQRQAGVVAPLPLAEAASGPALAIIDDFEYTTSRCSLNDNDLVMLFTDGLFEVEGSSGAYDEAQLAAAVKRRMQMSASDLFDTLLCEIQQFTGGQPFQDDVCLVGMEVAHLDGCTQA